MTKGRVQAYIRGVEAAFPGLRLSDPQAWTDKVAYACWLEDHTVGNKRTTSGPKSNDTIAISLVTINGGPGNEFGVTFTAIDLLVGITLEIQWLDLGVITDQIFIIPEVVDITGVVAIGGTADYRYKVGTFARRLTVGSQTIEDISDSCGPFAGKAIILWGTCQDTTGFNVTESRFFMGFASGPTSQEGGGDSIRQLNGVTGGPESFTGSPIHISIGGFTTDIGASITFSPGLFTIHWQFNNGSAWNVNYLVIGGGDVRAKVANVLSPTSAGNQVVSVAGIGQISGLLVLPQPTIGTGLYFCCLPALGWGVDIPDGPFQGSLSNWMSFATPQDNLSMQRTDKIIYALQPQFRGPGNVATLVSLGVNTFTLNFTTAYVGFAPRYTYLAISGPKIDVGSIEQNGSTGVSSTVIPSVFAPGAVLLASTGHVATPNGSTSAITMKDDAEFAFGASDGLLQISNWAGHKDNITPARTAKGQFTTRAMMIASTQVGAPLVKAEASIALTPTGFDLDWITATASFFPQILWLAFEAGIFVDDPCDGSEADPLELFCPDDDGVIDEPYSDFLAATGGVEPYTFSIIAGSLPTGLSLDGSTGEISGTPSVSGLFPYTARVVDDDGTITELECDINIGVCPVISSNNDFVNSDDGDPINAAGSCGGGGGGTEVTPFSGIYQLVPGKINDTVYSNPDNPSDTGINAIPNPFIDTAYIPEEV